MPCLKGQGPNQTFEIYHIPTKWTLQFKGYESFQRWAVRWGQEFTDSWNFLPSEDWVPRWATNFRILSTRLRNVWMELASSMSKRITEGPLVSYVGREKTVHVLSKLGCNVDHLTFVQDDVTLCLWMSLYLPPVLFPLILGWYGTPDTARVLHLWKPCV